LLTLMINGIPDLELDIWCNEDFLSDKAPEGEPQGTGVDQEEGSKDYWDNRPLADGGQKWMRLEDESMSRTDETVPWSAKGGRLEGAAAGYEVHAGESKHGTPLDSIRDGSLCTTLVHELSHSYVLVDDYATEDVKGMEDSYGWREATFIAQTDVDRALENADNLACFVLAMFLSENHWGTGIAEDMFADGFAFQSPP
ncbi:hypothetical protein FQN49_007716, partial [Arthroderma sp. PD_2]